MCLRLLVALACLGSMTLASPGGSGATLGGSILFWNDPPQPSIWSVRPDGTQLRQILLTGQNAKRPRLSFHSDWVAFDGAAPGKPPLTDFDIQLVRTDGSGLRTLTDSPEWDIDAQWAPGDKRISFTRMPPGALWRQAWIWTIAPDGSGLKKLAKGQDARWSPSGTRLVFDAPARGSDADLFVVGADGTGLRRLTATRTLEWPAAWSPDGRRILFTRAESEYVSDVFVMNADGSHVRRLTATRSSVAGAWSPDGSTIVFTKGRAGGSRLYLMRADGSHQRRLMRSNAAAFDPSWR
jgi:Tol biopolymer transport system component